MGQFPGKNLTSGWKLGLLRMGGATGRGGSYWGLNFEESGFMLRSTAAPLATCSS